MTIVLCILVDRANQITQSLLSLNDLRDGTCEVVKSVCLNVAMRCIFEDVRRPMLYWLHSCILSSPPLPVGAQLCKRIV